MQASDFKARKSGWLVKHQRGCLAFIPNPLPPPLALTWELFKRPFLTFSQAKEVLNVTFRSAQMNVHKMVEAKILEELAGRK